MAQGGDLEISQEKSRLAIFFILLVWSSLAKLFGTLFTSIIMAHDNAERIAQTSTQHYKFFLGPRTDGFAVRKSIGIWVLYQTLGPFPASSSFSSFFSAPKRRESLGKTAKLLLPPFTFDDTVLSIPTFSLYLTYVYRGARENMSLGVCWYERHGLERGGTNIVKKWNMEGTHKGRRARISRKVCQRKAHTFPFRPWKKSKVSWENQREYQVTFTCWFAI